MLFIVLILSIPTKKLISQVGQLDIIRVTQKILTEGILYPDAATSAVYFNDFFDLPDTTSGYDWDAYSSEGYTGAMTLSDGHVWNLGSDVVETGGGVLLIATSKTNLDSGTFNIQKRGSSVILTATKNILFETEFLLPDSTEVGAFLGFAYPDDDSVINYQATASIGFEKVMGANAWYFRVDDGSNTTSKTMAGFVANVDTGWNRIKFITLDTNLVVSYVNGKQDSIITTNIPNDTLMVPTFEVNAGSLYIGDIKAKQGDR